jgi:hypothetical protein
MVACTGPSGWRRRSAGGSARLAAIGSGSGQRGAVSDQHRRNQYRKRSQNRGRRATFQVSGIATVSYHLHRDHLRQATHLVRHTQAVRVPCDAPCEGDVTNLAVIAGF